MIRVFLADDHAVVRAGLKQIIGDAEGLSVVGEAGHGNEVLGLVREAKPHVLILACPCLAVAASNSSS